MGPLTMVGAAGALVVALFWGLQSLLSVCRAGLTRVKETPFDVPQSAPSNELMSANPIDAEA